MNGACRWLFIISAICLLGSCSSGTSTTPVQTVTQPAGQSFPAFDDLPERSVTEIAAFLNGSDFSRDMPYNRVAPQGVMGVFSPGWDPAGSGGRELAYAIYTLNLPEMDLAPALNLQFAKYGSREELAIALGNHTTQTWDWLEHGQIQMLNDFDIAFSKEHHVSESNDITVLMVFFSTDAWWLEGIGVDEAEPVSDVTVAGSFMAGPVGTEIKLHPMQVVGTAPYNYHWDFGDAATPAESDQDDPEVILSGEVGEYHCSLTITNGFGEPFIHEFPLTVTGEIDGWSNTIQPEVNFKQYLAQGQALAGVFDDQGYLVASTSVTMDNPANHLASGKHSISLQKFDGQGSIEFVRNWDGEEEMILVDMAVVPGDGVNTVINPGHEAWILGKTGDLGRSNGDEPVLIKVDSDGELLLSVGWEWEPFRLPSMYSIAPMADGSVWVAGGFLGGGFVARVGNDGSVSRARIYEYDDCTLSLMSVVSDGQGGLYAAGLKDGYSEDGTDGIIVMRLDAAGDVLWDFQTHTTGAYEMGLYRANGIHLEVDSSGNLYMVPQTPDVAWIEQGVMTFEPEQVLKFSPDGELLRGLSLDLGRNVFHDMVYDPVSDRLFLTGAVEAESYPQYNMELLMIAVDTSLSPEGVEARTWGTQESHQVGFGITIDTFGGILVVGDTCGAYSGLVKGLDVTESEFHSAEPVDLSATVTSTTGTVKDMPGEFVGIDYVVNTAEPYNTRSMVTMRYDGF